MSKVLSGQVTVTTAGTAVQGPSTAEGSLFSLAAEPANTNPVWIGNDGADDVTATNGYPLNPGDVVQITVMNSLAEIWFDATTNGEKVCWLRVK